VNETNGTHDANDTPVPAGAAERNPSAQHAPYARYALPIAIAAWMLPGLGHVILRRWGRGLAFFVAVAGLAIAGYLMRGNVFPPPSGDLFGTIGFLADAGSGVMYVLARVFERAGPDVSRAAGDYGTRFLATAGVVNLLAAFDAYEIARGRRH
jgi:hypothetical protein